MRIASIGMSEQDPYATPTSEVKTPERDCATNARKIVREWENLRFRYNAILFVAGVIVLWVMWKKSVLTPTMLLVEVVTIAIGANVAFLLGPAWEVYSCVYRNKSHYDSRSRLLLFGAGVFFSLCVLVVVGMMEVGF